MPTLDELKAKWFIPMDGSSPDGVPCRRHSELGAADALTVSTDGNLLTRLIDGKAYMRRWHDAILAIHGMAGAELYHAGWRFEGVKTLGATVVGPDALDDVNDADGAAVSVYPLLCRNIGVMRFNLPSVDWLRLHGVWTACLDNRFPIAGSNHQKFAVMKNSLGALTVLGSIDISKSRWDTTSHLPADPDRDSGYRNNATHDTGVLIVGPAVSDVEKTYRERWNDPSRTFGLEPLLPPQPLITTPYSMSAGGGTHSVQVLRTYGITSTTFGYSWSPRGEFTVWASYLNAIKRAESYIYIEDQYFLPFDWPPCFSRTGLARDTDLIYQLGEAIKRGVLLFVVLPAASEDFAWLGDRQKYQRDVGVNYLQSIKDAGATGDVVFVSLTNGTRDIYVHSKLMIVDEEFVLIGSANVGQRSMTTDGELHVGIVDGANVFAKELRKELWAEHSGASAASLDDPTAAYGVLKGYLSPPALGTSSLKPYDRDRNAVYPAVPGSTPPPSNHSGSIRNVIEPYNGPPGLR